MQGLRFRCKREQLLRAYVVKGLHPESVTAQMQALRSSVPQRESKHAAKARNGGKSPLRVGGEDDFGVRIATEAMMKLFEFLPDLAKIVNFSVVHHPVPAACE